MNIQLSISIIAGVIIGAITLYIIFAETHEQKTISLITGASIAAFAIGLFAGSMVYAIIGAILRL